MSAASDIGLCGEVCMGLYGEIFNNKKIPVTLVPPCEMLY
jgi:hypothetical protein